MAKQRRKEEVMNIKELTDLLVTSSQRYSQAKFIPWWEGNHEEAIYCYDIFPEETVRDARACIEGCSKEELISPVGRYGLTLFHLLVWHNFYDTVEHLLSQGRIGREEINMPDHKGNGLTSFLLTCMYGNLPMAKLLLAHGADGSACDKRGMNGYHFLAWPRFEGLELASEAEGHSVSQRAGIARLLDCDINKKEENGLTPLARLLATEYSSSYTWPLAEVFLEKGAETDYVDENGNSLLMMAMANGHKTAALKLMGQCPEMLNKANNKGQTPVSRAASFRSEAMYIALTDHGAEPGDVDMGDMFPLSQIASNAFCGINGDDKDGLAIALYLTKKLINQADLDDDDELGEVTEILHNALITDEDAGVLDLFQEVGFDFTVPIHYRGDRLCLRDACLQMGYGFGVVRKMAGLGVDMDKAVIDGRTPANILAWKDRRRSPEEEALFEEAVKFFSKESMEELDKYGVAAVHLAAREGHVGMLRAMVEKGVDINLAEDVPAQPGITPLHEACAFGHADVVRFLVSAGADDTAKNLDGETPAHFALMDKGYGKLNGEQRGSVLKELKHVDIPRNDGQVPLMLLHRDIDLLLPIFLEKGVDVNRTDNNGMTAMMLYPDKDLIKELLRAGADIHLADKEGNTALHHALKECHESAARFLVKKGANYNCPNNEGETPVQIAAEGGFDMVLDLMTDIE